MSKAIKCIFMGILIIAVAAIIPSTIYRLDNNKSEIVKADTGSAEWSETVDDPTNPTGGTTGDDTFTVLQIVPYKGLNALSYLVGGEEPIDTSLLPSNIWTTKGVLSTLGTAVSLYNSYQEDTLELSGTPKTGWQKGFTVTHENGYFLNVGKKNGGFYNYTSNSYIYVGPGQGDYKIVLSDENTDAYNIYNPPTNRKNVVAYFVSGKPAGVTLYNSTNTYKPILVNKNLGHGDYDYNCETMTFVLNKGLGDYDVIFQRSGDSDATYYMLQEGFQIVNDNSGDYSWNISYVSAGTNKGDYDLINAGFVFNRDGGTYKWVQDNSITNTTPNITYNNGNISRAEIYGQEITKTYQFTNGITMLNNEWFKRYVLGIPANQVKNTKVDVITMTPAELNALPNTDIIDKADLFYISENLQNNDYVSWYRNYTQEGLHDVDYSSSNHIFKKLDLNWQCTEAVFKRIAGVGGTRASVMISAKSFWDTRDYNIDYSRYTDMVYNDITKDTHSTICNVAKLYLMLMQRDIVSFYNAFMNPYTNSQFKIVSVPTATNINPSGTTGSFVRPDQISKNLTQAQFDAAYATAKLQDIAIYWNMITFLPYEYKEDTNTLGIIDQSLATEFPNMNILVDPSDLHENVVTMDGSEYVNKNFVTKSLDSDAEDYNSALIHVNSQDGSGTYQTSVNIAETLNYLTNTGSGYGSDGSGTQIAGETGTNGEEGSNLRSYVSVLNIEPTADFSASDSKIKDIFKNYNLNIDDMTTTQFNSYIKDINTHYDVIYMGSGIGRFNLDASNFTQFNLSNLYKKMFFQVGDEITTALGKFRYYGDDLTFDKVNAVKGFLKAGYTIILDPTMYNLNNDTLNNNTNIYNLIKDIKNDSTVNTNVLNYANYDNDALSIQNKFIADVKRGLGVTRPKIELVAPVIDAASPVNYFYPVNGNLTIHFKLVPWGIIPSSYQYNAFLYLDINGDGIFDSLNEKIGISDNLGNKPWEGITESTLRHYYYTLDMKQNGLDLNGVYQWKIQVVRRDNPEIRSEVTGYAAYSKKKDIKILQIIDNPISGQSDYSLKSAINTSGSLVRNYFGYAAKPLDDYNIIVETKTVAEFEALYSAANKYTTATKATTGQLYPYHLLILDNQTNTISNQYGALQNIKDELAGDLGVIFTKGTIDYTNQQNYLDSNSYLFVNRYTYNQLNRLANKAGELYIYSGFTNLNQDSTYATDDLTRSNKGPVTEYPYNVGDKLAITANSYSRNLTMDYNSRQADGAPLVGWYCLSDNNSPVINSSVASDTAYKGIYSSSPNDVNNNYYLFNRGKVFYSGIVLKDADRANNDNEIKLFVNTIIAAFKNCGRKVILPPVIHVLQPNRDSSGVMELTREYIGTNTEIPFIFEIMDSSSRMDVSIIWDDPDGATGNWNQMIYPVTGTTVGNTAVDVHNMDNGKYAVILPVNDLDGSHVLTIQAVNNDGQIAELATTINYSALPLTVTIDNHDLITSNSKQYLYMDIDFSAIDAGESNLDKAEDIKIDFTISNAGENSSVTVTDSTGAAIAIKDGLIYDAAGHSYPVNSKVLPEGSYYLYIPASVMKGQNSKDITITAATDADNSGSSTVTLLRRSLFPLD